MNRKWQSVNLQNLPHKGCHEMITRLICILDINIIRCYVINASSK